MKWLKVAGGIICAVAIFGISLYFLLTTFVKKDMKVVELRKEYIHLKHGDDKMYDTFFVSPESRLQIKLHRGDDIVYDQIYETNKYLIRGPETLNKNATKHAIFGGCSFTWGEGLKPEETFSSQFQKISPDIQGYNLSFPGGGLHTQLRYHELYNLKDAVKEEEGYFFYTFIPPHLARFFLRFNFLAQLPDTVPAYKVEKGKVVYKGMVKDQDLYHLYRKAHDKGLGATLVHTQDPFKWTPEELTDFSTAVNELKNQYLKKFPKGHFYFLYHPLGNPTPLVQQLKVHLVNQGIDVIDLSHEFGLVLHQEDLVYDEMFIEYDGHPNALSNELGARALQNFLTKPKMADRKKK